MQGLFALLALIAILILIVGLINPRLFRFKSTNEIPKRLHLVIGALFLFIVSLAFFGHYSQQDNSPAINTTPTNKTPQVQTEPPKAKSVIEPSLNITPEEFRLRFNKTSELLDTDFHINKIELKDGAVFNTANITLSKNNALIVTATKSGLLNSVISISSGDGTMQSGANMLFLSIMIVRSISEDLPEKEATQIVMDLMKASTDDADGKTHNKLVEGINYSASSSKTLGYWFSADLPEDK